MPHLPVSHDFAEQQEIKNSSAARYVAVFRPRRRISSGPSAFSERPAPEAALVNGLVVDAWALGSDLAALTSAYDLSDPQMQGNLEMNAAHFEQISDCWSSEEQPATYYRTAAARARRLQADATTSRVKQYLDTMIAHCEGLAGKVEPGVSSAR